MLKDLKRTPIDVAEGLEVGESTVWNWICGRTVPDAITLDELTRYLRCEVTDIYPR